MTHYLPACTPTQSQAAERLELAALGDFDRSNASVSIVSSDADGDRVSLPEGTRAAEITTLGDRSYWGASALRGNDLSLLLWPRDRPCELTELDLGAGETLDDLIFGASFEVGGVWLSGSSPTGSFLDLNRGLTVDLPAQDTPARLGASVSRLGTRLLVAGGSDPASGRVLDSAELIDPRVPERTRLLANLSLPRTRHAAVALPGGGTLLIGGEGEDGRALSAVEVVLESGAPRRLDSLSTPRVAPQAVLLDADRVLVGGGFEWGASSETAAPERRPVPSVEFLHLDLAQVAGAPVVLEPAALNRAFVRLAAGGALAVGGCAAANDTEPSCVPCEPQGCVSRHVWWIDGVGSAHRLADLDVALASAEPQLVSGTRGEPWLVAGERVARFDPWQARFVQLRNYAAPDERSRLAFFAPGLFAWLSQQGEQATLRALFHDTRSTYSQDVTPLLLTDGRGLLPHRPPAAQLERGGTLRYSVGDGLQLAGSSAVASIAETRYADFTLTMTLRDGPPPLVRLARSAGDSAGMTLGGLDCPWPSEPTDPSAPADSASQLWVARSGERAWLGLGGWSRSDPPCTGDLPEHVAVEFVGPPDGVSHLTRIDVHRQLP